MRGYVALRLFLMILLAEFITLKGVLVKTNPILKTLKLA